ncbi:MAG: extracellular solute-binding protein [Anaerolineales bacterium]|nr:MAG: extracellular solute-binding protein [Anaerolineales bacterium]
MKKPKYTLWIYTSFFLVVVLVLSIAGCSSRNPFVATLPPASSVDGEQAIITFAASEYQRQLFEPLMEIFHEQNPDITVQFVDLVQFFSPEEEYNPQNTFRKLAQAADTVLINAPFSWNQSLDLSRYFLNLQPLYEADPSFQPEDFWSEILTSCEDTFGNIVGLPLTASINGIFYDEAAFDATGVPYPQPGWTWDDFQKTVTSLADKRGSEIKYGFYDQPDLGISILAPLASYHLQRNSGEVDAAALFNEVKWYIDLAQAGMLFGIQTEEDLTYEVYDRMMKLFQDDALRPAMWADALISWIPISDQAINPDNPFSGMSIDRFSFAPYPVSADGSSAQTSQSLVECAAISAGSTNPRAAWAWLDFLSRHWIVMDKTRVHELVRAPSRKSVAETDGYWNLLPAKAEPAVRYTLDHGTYGFAYPDLFAEIRLALGKTISENADFALVLEAAIAARPETTPSPSDEAPIVVATPRAPLPEGVTVIDYYYNAYDPNEFNALTALVEQYNQREPSTQVSLFIDFTGSWEEHWSTTMANNFDCFTADAPYWGEFDAESVLNLNSLMNNEPATFVSDFPPQMLDKFSHEGNLYALPASSQLQMLAYNTDLLARRGLSAPPNDWTFDDFIDLASAAASISEIDPSYGYLYDPNQEFILLGRGLKWLDMQSTPPQVYLDTPEMLQHLRWLSRLKQDGVFIDQRTDWERVNTIMFSGQLAFWPARMGEKAWWFQGSGQEPAFKIGMAPMPQLSGGNSLISDSIDRGHYISTQSQDPLACWEWIKFISEQPNLFAGLPARQSIVESPAWEAVVGRADAAAYRAAFANYKPAEVAEMDMLNVLWPVIGWRDQAIWAALNGQELPQALTTLQNKAEVYLACTIALDLSKPNEQLTEDILACQQQADPEGN